MRARRLPVIDWYVGTEESAVLVSDRVLVLSALATTILQTLDDREWTPATEIAAVLTRTFGAPPGGRAVDLTRDSLTQLARVGVVELSEPTG